jgi:predicted ATPase/class 3 adenylate cyclase
VDDLFVADDSRVLEQPSGTVTLVFTDIEGSTRLLHELGQDAYLAALAEHRRVVREAFSAGYEAGSEGDSFFYAFASPAEAVGAVQAAMKGLESGPIRIRVGIHTGEPGLDPPTYVGMDVHLAARVMSVGHGGQVLISRATRDLVEVGLTDLGEHRVKDIVDPVWLFQLGAAEFPPLKSLNNTNLPTPASSFLGREPELVEAESLLLGSRLLTVSGPGGAGKTRFAIELASRQLARFPNGVFWVALAALRDSGLVVETISQALGSRNGLAGHIGDRRMLLLVDNLEQVIESAPDLAQLLTECPQLSLLVTSRELLRVQGEVEFPLPPLVENEAVELFCTRARCEPDEAVRELCRRLDGLPLAIELAAARTAVFAPDELVERLGERLDLLKGGRDADPRQQTLRATIQWSYDLLDEAGARLFRRLAVFAGGCTFRTAEEVCGTGPDTLQSLVEKSLIRRTENRFWMLETIREFALTELDAHDELGAARADYFQWMVRMAEEAGYELEGHNQTDYLDRLHAEHENIREVVALALNDDPSKAIRILIALDRYWWIRPGEANGWFERALELLDQVPPRLAAHALRVAGTTAWFYGQPRLTYQRCEQGLAIFEQLGDEVGISLMYSRMAPPLMKEGRLDEGAELNRKAVEMHRRLGLDHELAIALEISGSVAWHQGNLEEAARLFQESIDLERNSGNLHHATRTLLLLGDLRIEQGELEPGLAHLREGIEIAWSQRNLIDLGMLFSSMAIASGINHDNHAAALYLGAADRLDEEIGPSQFRAERDGYYEEIPASVVADTNTQAAGRAMTTAEAVALALGYEPR